MAAEPARRIYKTAGHLALIWDSRGLMETRLALDEVYQHYRDPAHEHRCDHAHDLR